MKIASILCICLLTFSTCVMAQISPGELAQVHTKLEGMSNCTKCHELGKQLSNDKCLACHNELKKRISQQKGYHFSSLVRGKSCTQCHSDHHGLNFKIVRFDETKFDHKLAGYVLNGAHAKKKCKDCHKVEFITDKDIKKKKFTFLGLDTKCLGCHTDYHQNTLSSNCENCHTFESYKPAAKFNHANARFILKGKHLDVPCIKCHKTETRLGKKFQVFSGLQFKGCINCHTDVHNNQFGQNCTQCHSEISFHNVKELKGFDHNKTKFKLLGKHQSVDCKKCHLGKITDPLKHEHCLDCHKDYHEGQFSKQGLITDCSDCHSNDGFAGSSYSLEEHQKSIFPLKGSHLATPCIACHKKEVKWSFKKIGLKCIDCHENIHKGYIDIKYYPDTACDRCHNTERWNLVRFDHSKTNFALKGVHEKKSCKDCHFKKNESGNEIQKFSSLSVACQSCHEDEHNKQFELKGITDCSKCHGFDKWKIDNFNHDNTSFKLDGKHSVVPCLKCHKTTRLGNKTYIVYKLNDVTCKSCH